MDWVMVGAAVFAAWAAVSVVGNERQRRVERADAEARIASSPEIPHA